MFVRRAFGYALGSFLLISPPVLPQETQKAVYPDSFEGLGRLMGDLVSAARTNSAAESHLIAGLRLPDAASWFAEVLGTENGAKLFALYQKSESEDDLDRCAKGLFGYCAAQGLDEIKIEQLGTPGHPIFSDKVLSSMIHPVPLYRVSFRKNGREEATSNNYVYVQGGFRRISDDVFMALPGIARNVIRLAENVLRPKVQVKPETPSDSKGKPMRGKVLVRVLIDANGNVKNIKLEKGDPVLGQAAAEAVRQWRFEPFTVGGVPCEVETAVSLHFP